MLFRKWAFIIIFLFPFFAATLGFAADNGYRIALERQHSSNPISRSEILAAVNGKYKGRILSVEEKRTVSTPDCHIIRMVGLDGEWMVIYVACGG